MLHIKKEYIKYTIDMKRFVFALVASLMALGCSPMTEDIILKFNVTDATAREVVLVYHTNIQNIPLTEGVAEVVITGVDAAYAKVYYGMSMQKIYIESGDVATISFNGADINETFSFDGEKKEAVSYLRNVTMSALEDEAYALEFEDYLAKLNGKRDDALKLLKANAIKGAGDFVKMEVARIKYAYAAPLLMYPVGHMMMAQKPDYQPGHDYYDVISSLFKEDAKYVNIDEYRNFIIEAAHVLDAENRDVTKIKQKTVAQMKYIADHFKNTDVIATILHYLACSYVDVFGVDGINEMMSLYNTYVKDAELNEIFVAKLDKWNRSKPGKKSPDFKAQDVNGKEWTLADFKGKYIYIDLWATWCNPCKRELPYLKELEKKFEGSQIVFIGLSTDGDKGKWEQIVQTGTMPGVQLHIGPRSEFQKAYNIDGIPRFILLDKEGIIINNNMSRPSSEDTYKFLESLDGIKL